MDDEQQVIEWIRQSAKGDRIAAGKFLRHYYESVYAYLRRLSGNDHDAADLTQDTFRKVWLSVGRFREDSRVTTWLHRIAYCTWVDWIRKLRKTSEQSQLWWTNLPDGLPTPNERAEKADQIQLLWMLVQELPDIQSQAIHLRYGQQIPLKEISEILEIPLSTLKVRLRQGLDQLKTRLNASNHTTSIKSQDL